MADKGKDVGDMEYGRCPYAGTYVGNMEYGRCPGVGYKHFPVLTVQSSPESGVEITVDPADINGQANGTTEFTRDYEPDTNVTLTAPATFGDLVFSTWKLDGSPVGGNPIIVGMDEDHIALVEYEEVPPPPAEEIKGTEMLYVKLPRRKFWTADYPNLDPNAEGRPIPLRWGEQKDIIPICVDTETMTFKLMDNYGRPIKSVDKVLCGSDELVVDVDYEADLDNAEITIAETPLLQPNTVYYFSIESDYEINGTDYLRFAQGFPYGPMAGYFNYDIDGAGVWTVNPSGYALFFMVIVKDSLNGQPYALVDNFNVDWSGWNMNAHLRDTAARTRLGQRFITPASGGPWYLYEIKVDPRLLYGGPIGDPPEGRISRIAVFNSIDPEVQVGSKSYRMEDYPPFKSSAFYPQRSVSGEIRVDFKAVMNPDTSLMENIADVYLDSYVTILGGSESANDPVALAALKAARPEKLSVSIEREIQYREFLDKLEGGQFCKFLPTLDRGFTILFAEAGEPEGTIHFRDHDMADFECFRDWNAVFQKIKIKYAEDAASNDAPWRVREAESQVAAYCYRVQRTLELATYLLEDEDGEDGASKYGALLENPPRIISFRTFGGKGSGLIPWQKIKVTRARADAPGGKLEGILFRVLEIKQLPISGSVNITAILDAQTY